MKIRRHSFLLAIFILSLNMSALTLKDAVAAGSLIQEFELPKDISAPNSIALDAAGNVWFAEKVGKHIGMYNPRQKEFKSFLIPVEWRNVGPSRIAMGPKGDVWFSVIRWAEGEDRVDFVGQFSPADASFKRHDLSSEATSGELLVDRHRVIPEELLVDTQGVLWLLVPGENALYSYNPVDLALKAHVVPTANSYPRGLSIADDGVLWFSEANANKMAKFDPKSGDFAEYEIPTAFATPGETVVDGDGNVWFVELRTNRLGVFYPALKRFDEALLPSVRSLPNAITDSGDGRIWFLEYLENKVGLFFPKEARFKEFVIPTASSLPGAIAIDVKRNMLWFSETNTEAKRLGMLDISQITLSEDNIVAEDVGAASGEKSAGTGGGYQYLIFALGALLAVVGGILWLFRRRQSNNA